MAFQKGSLIGCSGVEQHVRVAPFEVIFLLSGGKGLPIKIRAGYEIFYHYPQLTPMILTLSVQPSRFFDLLTPDRTRLDPPISANTTS